MQAVYWGVWEREGSWAEQGVATKASAHGEPWSWDGPPDPVYLCSRGFPGCRIFILKLKNSWANGHMDHPSFQSCPACSKGARLFYLTGCGLLSRRGRNLRQGAILWLRPVLGEGLSCEPLVANTPGSLGNEFLGFEGRIWPTHHNIHYRCLINMHSLPITHDAGQGSYKKVLLGVTTGVSCCHL